MSEHPLTKDLLIERLRSQCPRELRGKIDHGLEEMLVEASPLRPFDGLRSSKQLALALLSAACCAQKLLYELQVTMGKANKERARAVGQLLDSLLILTNAACEMDGAIE